MTAASTVAAVVLAAGASRRYGAPKQLAVHDGRTLLEHVLARAAGAGLQPVVAVVPVWLSRPAAFDDDTALAWVRNPDPGRGLSHSLRLGFAALPPDVAAACILLGDQPTVPAAHLAALRAARGERPLVATRHPDGRLGPPAIVEREVFDRVAMLSGDRGLRDVLAADPAAVTPVPAGEALPDVDTPADLAALAVPCPGCGARVPAPSDAPTHPYIGASAGCWGRYAERLATVGFAGIGRAANDAYAAQHPGVDGRRQRQSVAIHLVALCHWLEHGIVDPRLTELTRVVLSGRSDWPWLPPPTGYELTVHDLPPDADAVRCRAWVEAVWRAWAAHHDVVRGWAAAALG